MKMNKIKLLVLAIFTSAMFTGCVNDDEDTSLPNYKPVVFGEDFETNAVDNEVLVIDGWKNYAEVGNAVWKWQTYQQNSYAEFTTFNSGDALNTGWLITPPIQLSETVDQTLLFQVSQSYVSSTANTLEVLISTDFDGTNVEAATWQALPAQIPGTTATYFEFQSAGEIDLSSFDGTVYVAWKVKGSGTNQQLDGSYQIDNVRIINK